MIHAINLIVGFQHMFGQLRITFDERPQRVAYHRPHSHSHSRDVDWKFGGWQLNRVHDALNNIDRLVANALKVSIDLDYGEDEAQVHCHWLLHSQQVDSELVYFAFGAID